MRKLLLFSSLFLLATACAPEANKSVSAQTQPQAQAESLLDVASPDDVAAELGLGETNIEPGFPVENPAMPLFSLEQQNRISGISLTQYFPVVIVINKSNVGPTAQTMKVYHRGALKYQFAVSTGREQQENATKSGRTYFSTTPTGWYAPTRTYEKYHSTLWQADMNNSVFFNGGIAMHATTKDHFHELGRRASGGCVRLMPANAKLVYDLVLSEGKGQVPVYTRTGQISYEGVWKKRVQLQNNWNTLIIVEDNPTE